MTTSNKLKYIETKQFQFRENSGGRLSIPGVALRLLDYRENAFLGICDGMLFISQEPFNGSTKLQFRENSRSLNQLLIPIELCRESGMTKPVEVDLIESNGDIFLKPVVG